MKTLPPTTALRIWRGQNKFCSSCVLFSFVAWDSDEQVSPPHRKADSRYMKIGIFEILDSFDTKFKIDWQIAAHF